MAQNIFPYTNIHELNLDWVLSRLKEFETWVNGTALEMIETMINEAWNQFFLNAAYDEATETLMLYIDRNTDAG